MSRIIAVLSLFLAALYVPAQPAAFLRPLVFYDPVSGPYIETSLTVIGSSVSRNKIEEKYRNTVIVNLRIKKDTAIVKTNRYNLHGPAYADSLVPPAFIDCQRYSVPNGSYIVEIELTDPVSKNKTLRLEHPVSIKIEADSLQSSAIQPVESFRKAASWGPLTKSGYDLVPFNSDFYPSSSTQLAFYYELYNAKKALGNSRPIVFEYFLETASDSVRLQDYSGSRRATADNVNPLIAGMDIKELPPGEYALVINARDGRGKILKTEKHFFSRGKKSAGLDAYKQLNGEQRITAFVGNTNNADTLQMYVESLWPIANDTDKEAITNESVKKEPESMKRFIVDFWQRRAADTANPLTLWANYYRDVQVVMANFRCGKQKGYYTDRGRVMLQYGMPSQRTQQTNESNTFPYEIWIYYRIVDRVNGHFFSNRRFVFVNKNLGDDCHTLVHSDMLGEINNPRWQYEVTRRNYDGIDNPDRDKPAGTQYNQFNEIYKDPR